MKSETDKKDGDIREKHEYKVHLDNAHSQGWKRELADIYCEDLSIPEKFVKIETLITDLLTRQKSETEKRVREKIAGMIALKLWPKYENRGEGGRFGSAGWDTANTYAQEAHNKDINEILVALNPKEDD